MKKPMEEYTCVKIITYNEFSTKGQKAGPHQKTV
jgi:hypothetical protein